MDGVWCLFGGYEGQKALGGSVAMVFWCLDVHYEGQKALGDCAGVFLGGIYWRKQKALGGSCGCVFLGWI